MSAQDTDAFACTVFQTLVDVVYILSSTEFQRTTWLLGNHPEHLINSYDETMEMFQENLELLLKDDLWLHVPLTRSQIAAIHELDSRLDRFDGYGKRGRDPEQIMRAQEWAEITSLAGGTLAILLTSPCGVVPSIA
jgi:hypothetical protein